MSSPRFVPPLALKVWNNASVTANTNSTVFNSFSSPFVSAFGHVSAAATITLMVSQDGTNFYAGPTVTTSGAGDFYIDATVGAQFLALSSSAAVTATASISAK